MHYTMAPLFMQRLQPINTPGTSGTWGGLPLWPGALTISTAVKSLGQGPYLQVDMNTAQALFLIRYNIWKQSGKASGFITTEEVVSKLQAIVSPVAVRKAQT
jgi:hypothetical protein